MRLSRNLDLSTPAEIRLPLLWIGVLAGQARGVLAATSGVESADEAVKYLLVGAEVVMTTSALLRHGIGHMRTLLAELTEWLDARGVAAIGDIRGKMSRQRLGDPPAFERGNYISIFRGWTYGAPPGSIPVRPHPQRACPPIRIRRLSKRAKAASTKTKTKQTTYNNRLALRQWRMPSRRERNSCLE